MHEKIVLLGVGLAFSVQFATAQSVISQSQSCPTIIAGHVEGKETPTLIGKLDFPEGSTCLVALILGDKQSLSVSLPQLEAAFQQAGSNVGTGGSTNLVSKGATAKVLSAAAEYGALTETASNQTVTLTSTLGGLPVLLGQKGVIHVCSSISRNGCIGVSTVNVLNRFSYGLVFDTTQNSPVATGTVTGASTATTAQEATFTANTHTLNSVTAKAVLLDGQAPSQDSIKDALTKATKETDIDTMANALTSARQTLERHCSGGTEFKKWQEDTLKKLEATKGGQAAEDVWKNSAASLIDALKQDCPNDYLKDAHDYDTAFGSFLLANNTFYQNLRAAPQLSLEYDYNSPANQPTTSTVRLIAQINKNWLTGSLNAAGSFYNSTPSSVPNAGVVRDFQVSGELAYNFNRLKSSSFLGDSTGSVAYYYQDQTSPAILNATPSIITGLPSSATQVFAHRGVINVAQAKFSFIPRSLPISLPVSVTWSNRTELVTHSLWRGQIGFSYNFDSAFNK
jgi:hypothetical protein